MDEENSLQQPPVTDDLTKRPSPYDMLMRQSRKMGGLATRTYDVTREFLKQDISTLHPDRVLFGRQAKKRETESASDQSASDQSDTRSKSNDYGNEQSSKQKKGVSEGLREGEEREARTLDPREGLRKIVRKSHQLLASGQTVILPMNLFPDTVTIDRTKVTITNRTFFWSSSVISIRIEDVLNVACSTGPIFGSLVISSRVMNSTDHYEINYFWRREAVYLKNLIQGYVIAQHNQIDTSHLGRRELIKTLLDLGNDSDY